MRNEIVAGLDDSPSGKAALEWAAQQARSTGAVLRAVHALDWPGRPPARASLGIMDPIGGPHCDEADALGRIGRWQIRR
jgi:nucleotide-binding universal stress UspA family protein